VVVVEGEEDVLVVGAIEEVAPADVEIVAGDGEGGAALGGFLAADDIVGGW